jgi:hypothetical protein
MNARNHILEGSGPEMIDAISTASRALVFVSVPWSGPERQARTSFRAAVALLQEKPYAANVRFIRLEVDADTPSLNWLNSIGFEEFATRGYGSLLWLESGKVVGSEVSVNSLGPEGIVSRTEHIWNESIRQRT